MSGFYNFEVIVIGGGHAGIEAATASARVGARTLLLTHNIDTLGQMSCNPAIGGIGKGHLVKEIDALDGIMARAIDKSGIQFRILNASKGPAVRATRAQADRILYKKEIREILDNYENLTIFQQGVDDLIVENNSVKGVVTQVGIKFFAPKVVLTVGTFLGGKIFIGKETHGGGRAGDPPSIKLAMRLRELPFNVGRLKTGTPPRICGKTIDFSKLKVQPGDKPVPVFSYLGSVNDHPAQIPCFIAYTNEKTNEIIRAGLKDSALFSGMIEGVGPRYCPSIEDKVVRFADKTSHQVFIEPEGLTVNEFYPNGLSTSLPFETQIKYIQSMEGFENAHLTRAGYAIEYDFFDPRDLKYTLETKIISGLFFAGQINGTTGYEEAAAQGLVAGANAALSAKEKDPFVLTREESYIGVLIDDLITLGTKEPYRMFTSRAEYRLLLREDNADDRLTEKGYNAGLVKDFRWNSFCEQREKILQEENNLKKIMVTPSSELGVKVEKISGKKLSHEDTAHNLIKRPEVDYSSLFEEATIDPYLINKLQIKIRYAGYIDRQRKEIEYNKKNEHKKIPASFCYRSIPGLSTEIIEKLEKIRPETVAQAGRISGVTPAAISLILIYLKKAGFEKDAG